jgi:hypothetical protein
MCREYDSTRRERRSTVMVRGPEPADIHLETDSRLLMIT